MSAPFKAGDVAIGQNFVDFPEHNGEDLLVVAGLQYCEVIDMMSLELCRGESYIVQAASGEQFSVRPYQLRRRKPPTTGEQSVLSLFLSAPQRVREPA